METLNNIIQTTLESFDFTYCIVVNLLTYFIINAVNDIVGKNLSTWYKRLVLLAVLIIMGTLNYCFDIDIKTIINSSILAPVFWSWILKPICKKFNLDYNQIDIV